MKQLVEIGERAQKLSLSAPDSPERVEALAKVRVEMAEKDVKATQDRLSKTVTSLGQLEFNHLTGFGGPMGPQLGENEKLAQERWRSALAEVNRTFQGVAVFRFGGGTTLQLVRLGGDAPKVAPKDGGLEAGPKISAELMKQLGALPPELQKLMMSTISTMPPEQLKALPDLITHLGTVPNAARVMTLMATVPDAGQAREEFFKKMATGPDAVHMAPLRALVAHLDANPVQKQIVQNVIATIAKAEVARQEQLAKEQQEKEDKVTLEQAEKLIPTPPPAEGTRAYAMLEARLMMLAVDAGAALGTPRVMRMVEGTSFDRALCKVMGIFALLAAFGKKDERVSPKGGDAPKEAELTPFEVSGKNARENGAKLLTQMGGVENPPGTFTFNDNTGTFPGGRRFEPTQFRYNPALSQWEWSAVMSSSGGGRVWASVSRPGTFLDNSEESIKRQNPEERDAVAAGRKRILEIVALLSKVDSNVNQQSEKLMQARIEEVNKTGGLIGMRLALTGDAGYRYLRIEPDGGASFALDQAIVKQIRSQVGDGGYGTGGGGYLYIDIENIRPQRLETLIKLLPRVA